MTVVLKDLSKKIRSWAADRQIIPNSNLEAQYTKLVEELGELALGIRKQDKELIVDSIGDIYVVATIMLGLEIVKIEDIEHFQNDFYNEPRNIEKSFFWLSNSIGDIGKIIARNNQRKLVLKFGDLIDDLNAIAIKYQTSLEQCVLASYEEIKDRKGILREDGIFVKESDLK